MTEVEWIKIFSENLKEMMDEKNLSMRELARRTELEPATIHRLVHGKVAPSFRSIINLSYVLDCTTDELIDFGDVIE